MTLAQVEMVSKDIREFVSGETDLGTAYHIMTELISGYGKQGYVLVDSGIDRILPKNCAVLVKGSETVGLRVVCHE